VWFPHPKEGWEIGMISGVEGNQLVITRCTEEGKLIPEKEPNYEVFSLLTVPIQHLIAIRLFMEVIG
jgi:hypothetical protein